MKKQNLLVFTLALAFGLFSVLKFSSSNSEKTGLSRVVKKSTKDVSVSKLESRATPALKPQSTKSVLESFKKPQGESEQPKPVFSKKSEDLYFQVLEGFAVIGEDMLLGRVEEGVEEGLTYKSRPKPVSLWQNSEVFYGFSKDLPEDLKQRALRAIEYFNSETNLRFTPLDTNLDPDAVVFTYNEKLPCSSFVGKVGGYQPIFLNSKCSFSDVLHEIMHSLGFVHEQQRWDRDDYIEVLWENIDQKHQINFALLPDNFGVKADFQFSYNSIMMYSDVAFAKPGTKSIKFLNKYEKINKLNALSNIDKKRLELIY